MTTQSTSIEPLELASEGRSKLTLLAGIIAAIISAAGLIVGGGVLLTTLTQFLDNSVLYARNDLIMAVMWVVFFLAFLVAGIHLIRSGLSRRLMDIVPGLSLYFAGLALMVNGFYFFAHQQLAYAALAIILGLGLVVSEWGSETI